MTAFIINDNIFSRLEYFENRIITQNRIVNPYRWRSLTINKLLFNTAIKQQLMLKQHNYAVLQLVLNSEMPIGK